MTVKIHLPKMIPASKLLELPTNSQKQSRHEFRELRKSIKENGFDESLLVRPTDNGLYEIVAGNHRYRAGVAEGMDEFPCVVRDDWDMIKSEIESVRRNYVRGHIDKAAFTAQVDYISHEASLPLDVIYTEMGFEDMDAFANYYAKEKEMEQRTAEAATTPAAVRMLDDMSGVLSDIFARYGHTVPNSFLIFPAGGRMHMYVASSSALKSILQAIAGQAIHQGIDINIALAGLLNIGASQVGFLKGDGGVEVNEEGRSEGEGSSDFEPF